MKKASALRQEADVRPGMQICELGGRMWVMMTYDVGVKRNARMRKTCRKYLIHVQKSVFEGNITERKLKKMKWEISNFLILNKLLQGYINENSVILAK